MVVSLYRYLRSPSFSEAEQTRLAGILHVLLLSFICAALAVITLNILLEPQYDLLRLGFTLLLIGSLLGLHIANHHGYVDVVASGLTVLVFAVITVSAALTTGFGGIGSLGYLVVVLLAGFLIHRNAGILFALVAGLTNLVLLLTINDVGLTSQTVYEWMIQTIFLVVGALLLYLVLGSLNEAQRSLSLQSTALQHIADAVIATDIDGQILTWNAGAERLYGYTAAEMIGQQMVTILETEGDVDAMQDELLQRGIWFGDVMQQHKDGSPVDVQAVVTLIHNEYRVPIGFVAVNRDLALKKALIEQQDYTTQLETAMEKDRELMVLKDRIIGTINHDLRTPLTVLQTNIELIERYPEKQAPAKLLPRLEKMQDQIQRMTGLMDEILDLRHSTSELVEHLEDVDVGALVMMMAEDYQLLNADHVISVACSDNGTRLHSSRRRLEHIFSNLIGNAIKYSPPPAHVQIDLRADDDTLVIRIADDGIGIPEQDIARIYDSFYRASNSGKHHGTGLGLAIVYHNVEQLGGTLNCQSELGVGTTFTVTLPYEVQSKSGAS